MRQYTQLTLDQRYQIYAFKKAGFNQTKIAKEVGVHKSTISRELERNQGLRGYRPKQAHSKAVDRKSNAAKSVKLIPGLIAMTLGNALAGYAIYKRKTATLFKELEV